MGEWVHWFACLCLGVLFTLTLAELQIQAWWDNAESIQHFQHQVTADSFVNQVKKLRLSEVLLKIHLLVQTLKCSDFSTLKLLLGNSKVHSS